MYGKIFTRKIVIIAICTIVVILLSCVGIGLGFWLNWGRRNQKSEIQVVP
jgi:hypothetical protein